MYSEEEAVFEFDFDVKKESFWVRNENIDEEEEEDEYEMRLNQSIAEEDAWLLRF